MAQAKSISTTLRQLMSRGRPRKSTSPLRAAHTEFVAAIAPRSFRANADCEVLEGRADHLQTVFAALHVYVTAMIAEFAQKIPGSSLDRNYLDQLLRGVSAEALRVFRNAAAEMRGHENWRAL
jgi:hypothetical protein